MKTSRALTAVLGAGVLAGVFVAQGAGAQPVVIETVPVGNPGNPGEQSRLASGDQTFYGGVAYTFWMGQFEVTAGEYTAFLNAVAATDTHSLYHTRMDYDADSTREGCNIKRSGAPGSFAYSVATDWADRPVNYVSWADAVRFANWLHNGQPTGAQDLTTTEDGSYFINGIGESSDGALEDVPREPDATWAIPTDDEWYKAAYHKNDGVTGNYWNYPTGADGGVINRVRLLCNDRSSAGLATLEAEERARKGYVCGCSSPYTAPPEARSGWQPTPLHSKTHSRRQTRSSRRSRRSCARGR